MAALLVLLPHLPFTRLQALAAGMTDAQLRSKKFRQLFFGVYLRADVEPTPLLRIRGALMASPRDAVASHFSALRLYGLDLGELLPIHVSTRIRARVRRANITSHQRKAPIETRMVQGLPVTSPLRTIIDLATKVNSVELIQAAEHMIHRGCMTVDDLGAYAVKHHLDGVRRVRRVLGWIREGVESPRESVLRLMIVFARLPEPRCNINIHDAGGRFLARGDLVYPDRHLLIEYDGWYHERSAAQRQSDLIRRERLEAAGWRVIVVTAEDMKTPEVIVHRVHEALIERGYEGHRPTFSLMWSTWFPTDDTGTPQDVDDHVRGRAA